MHPKKVKIKIWIDEAGRWPRFWPVVATCLAFHPKNPPKKDFIERLGDSKKMKESEREKLFEEIIFLSSWEKPSLFFGIWVVDNHCIDQVNIRQANKEAMQRALDEILRKTEDFEIESVLVDGRDNYIFSWLSRKPIYIVWGDGKVSEIGGASIIAKVFRDRLVKTYACLYPHLWLEKHKGYGTKKHQDFLKKKSDITSFHRQTYAPIKKLITKKPTLLLHVCCWPDATIPLVDLKNKYDITCFWYDPNIHPKSEYDKRLKAFKKVCTIEKTPYIEGEYNPEKFFVQTKWFEKCKEKWERCKKCYDFRLEKSAELALELGFDYFTTTLSISPHKDIKHIFSLGEKYSNEACPFLAFDFKKNNGFERSVFYTKENNIYRQNYCGCVYSENFPWKDRK